MQARRSFNAPRRAMRTMLAPLRIALLLGHVLAGIAISAAVFPWLAQRRRNRIIRDWSRLLLSLCGTRLRLTGRRLSAALAQHGIEPGSRGRMLLVNHISWIDVFAIHAAVPSRFVAKSEIRRWPLLGVLVSLVGTLYIERGRRHAVAAMNHRVRDRLLDGETVAVFPEGTTTDGRALLPFHSNLVAPAVEVGCDCWPVALVYTEDGRPTTAPAFIGAMGLVTSLWNIVTARRLQVEVAFLDPVPTTGERSRHHVAAMAAQRVAARLNVPAPTGRRFNAANAAGGTADTAPAAAADPARPAP
jgi:1-acyl-sn-glycerol-3-phosphate acyltransferase